MNSTILHVKVKPKRFHLNGNIKGFLPRTQKLEQHTNLTESRLCMEILKFIPVVRLNRLNQLVLRNKQR